MSALLFDIGGTTLRMARSGNGALEEVRKVPTPTDPLDAIALLVTYSLEAIPGCTGAYGGIAGIIEDGVIGTSANLPGWSGFAFEPALVEALDVPVQIHNDAALAGLGEAVYGAGKGYSLVGYLGIGTGVGGAHIVNGEIAPHASGFEPGHQVLDVDTGETLEDLVSGHALAERHGAPARELPRSAYDERTSALATGVYNVLLAWSPDVLVLGGSLMNEENGYRVEDVKRSLETIPTVLPSFPPVVRAVLGDECGLYGALALASR